jgi:uncharacterized membrane protein YkvA (DUF1232 family)
MSFFQRTATVTGAVKSSNGRHPLGQRVSAVLPMLRDAFTGRWPDASRGKLTLALAGVVYVVSPLDIMPELVLGPFGIFDDVGIAALSVAILMSSAEQWLDRGSPVGGPGPTPEAGQAGDVIRGVVVEPPARQG